MKKTKKKLTLKDVVEAAQAEGCKVTFGLRDKPDMPRRFEDDHPHVLALVHESERITELGNLWMESKNPNAIAADRCIQHGWAFALAAAWLRCYLKGELETKPPAGKEQDDNAN